MNENYVLAVGWLSLVCSHATTRVSDGAFPWLGLRRAEATVHVRVQCDCVRVRCDGDSRAQLYLLFILKTLGKLGKNVWRSLAMQGLDPNRISTYVLGVLVLKKRKAGFFFAGLIDTNPCFTCQLMHIFSPKPKELTISLLIA